MPNTGEVVVWFVMLCVLAVVGAVTFVVIALLLDFVL